MNEEKVIFGCETDLNGNYNFKNLPLGKHKIKLTHTGVKDELRDIEIKNGENIIDFQYPSPYVKVEKICPKNHIDNIIPIKCGLPTQKTLDKAKKGKIWLGGCDSSFCEKWYCKTHNINF